VSLAADGCSNWGIVVGRFVPVSEGPLTACEARLWDDGHQVARASSVVTSRTVSA
jgi:hypothetical protein